MMIKNKKNQKILYIIINLYETFVQKIYDLMVLNM